MQRDNNSFGLVRKLIYELNEMILIQILFPAKKILLNVGQSSLID